MTLDTWLAIVGLLLSIIALAWTLTELFYGDKIKEYIKLQEQRKNDLSRQKIADAILIKYIRLRFYYRNPQRIWYDIFRDIRYECRAFAGVTVGAFIVLVLTIFLAGIFPDTLTPGLILIYLLSPYVVLIIRWARLLANTTYASDMWALERYDEWCQQAIERAAELKGVTKTEIVALLERAEAKISK